jgi:putative aldouronate transport system permease protein
MVTSRSFWYRLETFLIYASVGLFAFVVAMPFLHVVARSLSAEAPILRSEVFLWPVRLTADAYKRIIESGTFWRAFRNSGIITVLGTLAAMVMTTLCAYPLSRKDLPGRGVLTTLVVVQMIFPAGLIPFYLTVRGLGMVDKWSALIIPYSLNTFLMIVLKSYFQALPRELEESAIIDGANDMEVLAHIMLPLAVPVIGTLALFYAVSFWNQFFPAVIFINSGNKQPLQVVLRDLIWSAAALMTQTASPEQYNKRAGVEALKAASVIIATMPMLVAYPFLQRYFMKGIMLGAIKG